MHYYENEVVVGFLSQGKYSEAQSNNFLITKTVNPASCRGENIFGGGAMAKDFLRVHCPLETCA